MPLDELLIQAILGTASSVVGSAIFLWIRQRPRQAGIAAVGIAAAVVAAVAFYRLADAALGIRGFRDWCEDRGDLLATSGEGEKRPRFYCVQNRRRIVGVLQLVPHFERRDVNVSLQEAPRIDP
ncbi:MAG: hypothetical protein M3134_12130 [Actinomycetota bacterium]|nr:hypothetical protein [Actinomycetota bacterium]